MTMTLDDVAAKLNELDLRVPLEVFEAIASAIRDRADLWSKWQTERCFRAKAEAELTALKALLRECEPIVSAHAESLHLLDGFKRQHRQYDALAKRVVAALEE